MRYTVIQKNLFNLVLRTGWLTHESFYRDIFNSERLESFYLQGKSQLDELHFRIRCIAFGMSFHLQYLELDARLQWIDNH